MSEALQCTALNRRNFLIGCCQTFGAALLAWPVRLDGLLPQENRAGKHASTGSFRLQPHYRTARPLDRLLLQAKAGHDEFTSEGYAAQIASILARWSSELLSSQGSIDAIETLLAPGFLGGSVQPLRSRILRSDHLLEIRANEFSDVASQTRAAFISALRSALAMYERLLTATFEITAIEVEFAAPQIPNVVKTRVRYEFVGAGRSFHREQRVGDWNVDWQPQAVVAGAAAGLFHIVNWTWSGQTQSRSLAPCFADVTQQTLGTSASYNDQLLHGSDYWRSILDGACGIDIYGHNGVSVGDIDNDGFDDLYICQPAGLPNRLYRNRGDGNFEDITEASGLGILENTACALFVDINNDGWQDLIVVLASGPMLFLNEGGGKFRHQPNAFHFATPPQGTFTGAAVADYDRDGWLDVYFCLYVYYQGTEQYKYPLPYYDAENGPPNFLLRNNRDGTFRDVTVQAGLDKGNTRYSFCCEWNDFNQDGWPDLYVVNDFGRKNLYRNNGDGTFTDVAAAASVEDTGAGMSVCWVDYDNDGVEDLYVADMWTATGQRISAHQAFQKHAPEEVRARYRKHAMGNSLFRNTATGLFEDKSAAAGVAMGRWSWSSDAWDFDHDGFADLYVTNGMVSGPSGEDLNGFFWRQVIAKSPNTNKPSQDYEQGWNAINELLRSDGTWSGYERNVLYTNNGDGTFSDVSGAVGLDFIEDSRSFALCDFDHDGRLEMFLKNRNAPQLRVVKNVIQNLPDSISFRLRGTKSNRDAIGAVITVETESGRQVKTVRAGSGFLCQHSKELLFGLGHSTRAVHASIRWPSGTIQELKDLPRNHRVILEEGAVRPSLEPFKSDREPEHTSIPIKIEQEFPEGAETWLLAPIAAPDFTLPNPDGKPWSLAAMRGKPVLLCFWAEPAGDSDLQTFQNNHPRWATQGLQLVTVNFGTRLEDLRTLINNHRFTFPLLQGSDDVGAVYSIVYRHLFDRYRDLALPTSFLIDDAGQIVKVYVGPVHENKIERDFKDIPRTAAERLKRALPFSGQSYDASFRRNYLSYGSVFFQRGYFEQAQNAFELAFREDPSSAEALYGLGSVYLQEGKLTEAQDTFNQVVKLTSSYPDTIPSAWNNLGLIATKQGNMEDAVQAFQQALRINPDHLIALDNLGNAYRQLRQWKEAQRVLEHALAVKPDDPEANYSLGMVFAQTDNNDRAYEHLRRALQSRPDYPEALNNLGVLYLRTNRRDEAVATFEGCMSIAPRFEQCYINLARVYALEQQPEKARDILQRLLKAVPNSALAQQALGQLPN